MNPALIILPQGASIGGVTTWACTLANALVAAHRPAAILIHGSITHHDSVALRLHPSVRILREPDLPAPHTLGGDLDRVRDAYARAHASVAREHTGPTLLIPTRDADSFSVCAGLAHDDPKHVRLVGWRHSPMPYESEIFRIFGPDMSRIVGVSTWLCRHMQRSLDSARIACVPNAVEAPPDCPMRPPLYNRQLELIYTGRIDEPIKRSGALPLLSDELTRRSIEHRITIIGDGPALESLTLAASSRPSIRILGPRPPHEVAEALAESDIFVLPSRIEGLSLAALEAMAQGCALAITHTPSGATDLLGDDEAGCLADASPEDDDAVTAHKLADAIQSLLSRDIVGIGRAAHTRARTVFSIKAFAQRAITELDRAAAENVMARDTTRPRAFHDQTCPASVPPDASARFIGVLNKLAGRRVIIHGCGTHTRTLISTILASPACIVAFADDDSTASAPAGLTLPVVPPACAAATGATDVVLSTYLHEEALWARRNEYERQGIRVHRLYATEPALRQQA